MLVQNVGRDFVLGGWLAGALGSAWERGTHSNPEVSTVVTVPPVGVMVE